MRISRFISFLSLALLLGATLKADLAHAGWKEMGACPELNDLDAEILSCGDNEFVAKKARECSEQIKASWKASAALLQVQMAANAGANNQNASEIQARKDYEGVVGSLDVQIKAMEENTSLVASYVDVMVDFPDSEKEENSASCFNEGFHAVDDAVWGLDDDIIQAKKIRSMALAMQISANGRHQAFDNSLFEQIKSGKTAAIPKGKSANSASDITGLAKNEAEASGSMEKGSQELASLPGKSSQANLASSTKQVSSVGEALWKGDSAGDNENLLPRLDLDSAARSPAATSDLNRDSK